jgi:hypothetical protein
MKRLILLSMSMAFASAHADNLCGTSFDTEVVPVEKQMAEAKDPDRWVHYAAFLDKFGPCLDGEYAEHVQGISEEALTHDWDGFVKFATKKPLSKHARMGIETGFNPEMSDAETLKTIQKNAKRNCPKKIGEFCRRIAHYQP